MTGERPREAPPGPVLITGAAGFIGSHVAAALLRRGVAVIGLDNFDAFYARELKHANLRAVAAADAANRFRLVEADITDAEAVARVYAEHRPAATIHLAARAGVRPSIADPTGYAHTNVTGASVVLEAAQRTHPRGAFLLASSSSVYGNNAKVPFAEADPVDHPISPYAATKRAAELIAHAAHHLSGMPVACLRFFTVFGPRQRPDLAIAKFLARVAAGQSIPVFGDGSMSRDFTYIDDIVAGVLAALDRVPAFGFRTWNLGSDRPVRLDEMVRTIGAVVGREPVIDRQPEQPGDVQRTYADLTRARAELHYEPQTPFAEGVRRQFEAASRP